MNQLRKPRSGDVIELALDELDERGRTRGRFEEYSVSVRGGVLGAHVRARVLKRSRAHLDAVLETELALSPDAVVARCPHVASCGGCSFQELAYPAQLAALARLLARTLAPLAPARIEPVLGCELPWRYRNKMDFTFGAARWIEPGEPEDAPRGLALGLHARGHFHKVLDVRACEIAFDGAVPIVASARELARTHELSAWDVRTHAGLLRHLVLRKSWATSEILMDLVTTEEAAERIGPYVAELLARHPEVTTAVQHVNPGVALVASGALARIHKGSGAIEERLAGLAFSISAESFFQTNTPQAERMVELVRAFADARPGQTVYDLYCGCGVFALALARAVGPAHVIGFELAESSVSDARANAARNGLGETRFVAGDLAVTLAPESLAARGFARPDVCIVDPPRAGLHPRVLASLAELAPLRIVYVSCNARTAAQDIAVLLARGWRLERVQPVDLFPHTPHLECLFLLLRG